MQELQLNAETQFNLEENRFFVLGPKPVATLPVDHPITMKLRRIEREEMPEVWGTLGLADDSDPQKLGLLDGTAQFSGRGNLASRGVTAEEIQLIKQSSPDLDDTDLIVERFLNLSKMSFDRFENAEGKRPTLRLTVMVPPSHGALAFFLHQDPSGDEEAIEYLQPQPTKKHSTSKRDRLTYLFDMPASFFQEGNDTENPIETRIIKILTFPRKGRTSKEVIHRAAQYLFKKKRYVFQVYDREANGFIPNEEIDTNKPTLLLLHGTFVNTMKTFGGLLDDPDGRPSWLSYMTRQGGPYQQVIGFDRPTILDGIFENEENLLEMLAGKTFNHPVDVISGSVGGLLAKHLARSEAARAHLHVRRGALVACSNGVKYFKIGQGVARFLSIMARAARRSRRTLAGLIASLAQHSAEYFLELPGSRIQTPGSAELEELLGSTPLTDTSFLPVPGDYRPLKKGNRFFRTLGELAVDGIVSGLYGTTAHDWVVETEKQWIMKPGKADTLPGYGQMAPFNAIHTHLLADEAVKQAILMYLESPVPLAA